MFIRTLLRAAAAATTATIMAATCACDNADFDYSGERCYFIFDNSKHQDATLQSALNPMAPGIFCRIYEGQEGGSLFFYFKNNHGLDSKKKANAEDIRRTRQIGVYNKSGIIVGYAPDGMLYAFDCQCPNCYYDTAMANYKLTVNTAGIATCNSCKREYDLNNNGLCANGRKLIKYRASCSGPLGVLSVVN